MDVGDLAVQELADEHVRRVADGSGGDKDRASLRVAPPASADAFAGNRIGERRDWSARGLQYDPVTANERNGLSRPDRPLTDVASKRIAIARWSGHSKSPPYA